MIASRIGDSLRALVLSAALACVCSTSIMAQQMETPRLEAGRVAGELLGGAYAGIGGYLIGRYVGVQLADLIGVESDATRRRLGYASGFVGGGLATAGVIYAVGSMGDQTGDFNATLLGTGAGFVAALGIARVFLGPDGSPPSGMSTKARWAAVNVLALLPAVGGTIGFNSTRRAQ